MRECAQHLWEIATWIRSKSLMRENRRENPLWGSAWWISWDQNLGERLFSIPEARRSQELLSQWWSTLFRSHVIWAFLHQGSRYNHLQREILDRGNGTRFRLIAAWRHHFKGIRVWVEAEVLRVLPAIEVPSPVLRPCARPPRLSGANHWAVKVTPEVHPLQGTDRRMVPMARASGLLGFTALDTLTDLHLVGWICDWNISWYLLNLCKWDIVEEIQFHISLLYWWFYWAKEKKEVKVAFKVASFLRVLPFEFHYLPLSDSWMVNSVKQEASLVKLKWHFFREASAVYYELWLDLIGSWTSICHHIRN